MGDMTKTPRHKIDRVFIHPEAKALDVLAIIVFACAYCLKRVGSMRARGSILIIPRVCYLQIQVPIYFSVGKGEEVRRHSLKRKKVFAADLESILLAPGLHECRESLPVRLSAFVFPEAGPVDTICPPVSS